MVSPKPITITYLSEVEAATSDIPGATTPQPFVVIGETSEAEAAPIEITDVTGLQAIITDLQDRLTAAEGKITSLEAGSA